MGLGEAEPACAQPHRDDEGDCDSRSDPCDDAPAPDVPMRRSRGFGKGGRAGYRSLGDRLGCGCTSSSA